LNISHPLKKTKNKILDRPLLTDEVNSNQVKDDVLHSWGWGSHSDAHPTAAESGSAWWMGGQHLGGLPAQLFISGGTALLIRRETAAPI